MPLTDDQHAARRLAIGGSDVAAILGISPWRSGWEVWAEKVGKLEPWTGNAATEHGHAYERAVLDYAERDLGCHLIRNVRVPAEGIPLAVTLDAATETEGVPVEAKTTGLVGPVHGDWGVPGTDEVPECYLVQVHAQLICTRAEIAYLYSLIPGRGTVRYEILPIPELHDEIIAECCDWWERYVVAGDPPPLDETPPLAVVKRLRREPNKTVQLDTADADLCLRVIEAAKSTIKSAKSDKDSAEANLLLMLDDAECGQLADGRTVTYMETSRRGYEVKPTTYRSLKVKGKRNAEIDT